MSSLGSCVIHGDNAATLEPALSALRGISDYLVTIDSGSVDGSHEIATRYADRVEIFPWQGYGAARARAWELLHAAGVQWMFFLDSDELLCEVQARNLVRLVRHTELEGSGYRVACRNLDLTGSRPYVFYTHHRVRLFRSPVSPWSAAQIVHEAFPKGRYPRIDVAIDHRFLVDDAARSQKERRYALLWAIQHAGHREPGTPRLSWLAHLGRDLLSRGALFRGGLHALRSARLVAEYSRLKHQYLRDVMAGAHRELLELYQGGDLVELFRRISLVGH